MGADKDTNFGVDFQESREYHNHSHYMKGVRHGVCQILVDVWLKPTTSQSEFMGWGYPGLE